MAQEINSVTALGRPVERPEQDEFNRLPFCEALADRIAQIGNPDGAAVVGLYGKWGFGKSSMLNLIEDRLATRPARDVVVARFNPWLFTNEEELLKSFFEVLAPMRETNRGKLGALADLSRKYGGQAGMLADSIFGESAGKLVDAVFKGPSLEEINAGMQQADDNRTIVLLIDDLDRLDRAEVLLMLKLVRLNSNLPRLVYLLAFDDEIIAKTVGGAYGLDAEAGREFLEKIVQFPFAVPAIGEERLLAYVLRHARHACSAAGVKASSAAWAGYEQVCRAGFSPRLRTPRQAIRYGAAMDFSLPMLAGEVDPVQQMIIEGLRLLYPELYAMLRDRTGAVLASGDSEPLHAAAKAAVPGSDIAVKAILDALLAPADAATDSPFFHPRYWQRYFEYAVRLDSIGNKDLAALRGSVNDSAALAAECVRLSQRNADEFDGVVRDLAVAAHSATRLRWIAGLMRASVSLPDIGNRRIWQTWVDLIAWLAFGSNAADQPDALAQSDVEQVLQTPCAPGLLPILSDALAVQEELLRERRYAAQDFGGSPLDLTALRKVITDRIEDVAPAFVADMLKQDSVGYSLFAHLGIYASDAFRDWMETALRETPARAIHIVRHFSKGNLEDKLRHQSWIGIAELAAILYTPLGETIPLEPRHPIDQIIALRSKHAAHFAG
jgi:hypothetical protein